jgi:hypothetical protein
LSPQRHRINTAATEEGLDALAELQALIAECKVMREELRGIIDIAWRMPMSRRWRPFSHILNDRVIGNVGLPHKVTLAIGDSDLISVR